MLPAPTASPSMIPVPDLLLGAGGTDANHVSIETASSTLGEFQTIKPTFLANQVNFTE